MKQMKQSRSYYGQTEITLEILIFCAWIFFELVFKPNPCELDLACKIKYEMQYVVSCRSFYSEETNKKLFTWRNKKVLTWSVTIESMNYGDIQFQTSNCIDLFTFQILQTQFLRWVRWSQHTRANKITKIQKSFINSIIIFLGLNVAM